MRTPLIAAALLITMGTTAVGAQAPAATERRALSPRTALGGVGLMVLGAAMLTPHGDEVRLGASTYCVDAHLGDTGRTVRTVDAGACGGIDPRLLKAGLLVIGAGAILTIIGSVRVTRRVAVAPSATGLGAVATVTW